MVRSTDAWLYMVLLTMPRFTHGEITHAGERCETVTYFEDTLGRPPGRSDDPLREGVAQGTTLVGSPDLATSGSEESVSSCRR